MHHLSWLEAVVVGVVQGVSELFPVSSLGHSVLLPAVLGGSWARDLDVSAPESPYLAFIVGTHVATALALLVFYRRDWVRLAGGLVTSVRYRRLSTPDERLIWQLVVGTVPVGLVGLVFEHWLRTHLGRPVPAACFLMVNGVILLTIEWYAGRTTPTDHKAATDEDTEKDTDEDTDVAADARLSRMPFTRALAIGSLQVLALGPGISRSGIATAAGMRAGLRRDDAVRFSFLLATPVILAAGVLKLPDLLGPLGDGIRPQVLVGSLLAGVGAYVSIRWLTRWVHTNTLRPFGWYCLAAGGACLVLFALR
ncbi:MAG TPA: undecaprenyl-diphosphate phosphatase [Nocardioides sp.]|nr:undecaprenyl-diphosphate phosphatase [Nocardioides sp.]